MNAKAHLVGINSKYIHPAMGVFQLVANSNHPVSYQESLIKDSEESIISKIQSFNFDIIGFSCYIWNVTIICNIIKTLRKNGFKKPIFIGGPESYYKSAFFINEIGANYIINGEGEESFNELMDFIDGKTTIEKVSNLYYLDKGKIKYTYTKLPNINNIKHDYSLIKDFKNRIVYLESSRGCYFKCSYCMASLEKKVRFFPIEKIKDELLFLLNHNAKTIKFLDRSFNVNKEYMLDILKFINEHDNLITTFQFEIVGDMLDEEVINYIIHNMRKKALRFEIGIQSTNEITTKAVFRKQNFDLLKKNILLLRDYVVIHTDLIAGLPYENLESFKNTFNESYLLMTEEMQLGFLKELKGTYISEHQEDHKYNFSIEPPYEIIDNNYISKADLQDIHLVEEGLEKYHNKKDFPKTMAYIFEECKLNPYETFKELFIFNNLNFHNLQHDQIALNLYNCLKDKKTVNSERLLYNIQQDYLLKYHIRPKIWWENQIEKSKRKDIYDQFIIKFPNLNINELYNRSILVVSDNHKIQPFVVMYYGNLNRIYYL